MEKELGTSGKLPEYAQLILGSIQKVLGVDKFILYGGAPMDLLLDKNCTVNDYDIAIGSKNLKDIKIIKRNLNLNGFEIIESDRRYYIYKNVEVILIYAEKDEFNLDICFMENLEMVGQFNIESLYWSYPENKYFDKYNSIEAVENKKIISIRGLQAENIFLLLARFIYLCSKYGIVINISENKKILDNFISRLNNVDEKDKNLPQYTSCFSSILKSIIKSKNRIRFMDDLFSSNLLRSSFFSIHYSIGEVLKNNKDTIKIKKARCKKDLITVFLSYLQGENRRNFIKGVELISTRNWDKYDSNINFL